MYCPTCGSEERQMSQFCRGCGADLRPVRVSLERPDTVTASAISAREEIGRAVADKIRETEDARDLQRVAEDVLPQLEKFLESPEAKRLRRMRAGVILASVGLGSSIFAAVAAIATGDRDLIQPMAFLFGLGIVAFMLGLGFVMNGVLFTRPRKGLEDRSGEGPRQNLLDALATPQLRSGENAETFRTPSTADFSRPAVPAGASVTDQTTRHLKSEV